MEALESQLDNSMKAKYLISRLYLEQIFKTEDLDLKNFYHEKIIDLLTPKSLTPPKDELSSDIVKTIDSLAIKINSLEDQNREISDKLVEAEEKLTKEQLKNKKLAKQLKDSPKKSEN